jgi:hypothetical protein
MAPLFCSGIAAFSVVQRNVETSTFLSLSGMLEILSARESCLFGHENIPFFVGI